jgi:hypothetical protein
MSDFKVWRHTWAENWVNCAVLTSIAQASELFFTVFHTENCAVLLWNPTVSSVYLPAPRWHHLKALNLPKLTKERRLLRSLKRTDRYLNFATQKIGIILLWPMWQENSKRQPFFIHNSHTHKKTHRTDKKLTNLIENLCCIREHSVQFYLQCCTQLNCTV